MPPEKTGIDGRVELAAVLASAEFSGTGLTAIPEAQLYAHVQAKFNSSGSAEAQLVVARLIRRLGIWWSPTSYATFPILVPWTIRDRSCRYDAGPEAWGSARADGLLRDDNSTIKKLPLSLRVDAPGGHPYAGRKPWRGFTACHVWGDLAGGMASGEDQWLYSFLPNLVWLPSPLAPLSDRQGSFTQGLLQRISIALFRNVAVTPPVAPYAEAAWAKLSSLVPADVPGDLLETDQLARFDATEVFFKRRLNYNRRLTTGVALVRSGFTPPKKIICSRYTDDLPTLPHTVLDSYLAGLRAYDDAVAQAIAP